MNKIAKNGVSLRLQLDELIQYKHLLAHPFYTRWQAGQLKKEELQGYAQEYYRFESEFPRFVSQLHAKCEDPEIRQALLQNLLDEEGGEETHPELWLRFAEGLGLERDAVEGHFHSDETEHLIQTFKKLCSQEGLIAGLAALYAYERQQPDVARQKLDGLKSFYGMTDEKSVEFFKVHQTADLYHSETEISSLIQLCDSEPLKEKAKSAVKETLDALYDFLDGVDRRYRAA